MRKVLFALVGMAMVCTGSRANATMRIGDDTGGLIRIYVDQYAAARTSGERVVIDGACLSACTLVLGIVPRDHICVTRRAILGFHAAWIQGADGNTVLSVAGTQILWAYYPQSIRRWITHNGGLTPKMIFLRGSELMAMYPVCKTGTSREIPH